MCATLVLHVNRKGIASAEMNGIEAMPSGSQPSLTLQLFTRELPTPKTNVVHDSLAQGLNVLSDVAVGEHSQNEGSERLKEERACLSNKMNAYTMEKNKLKILKLKKQKATKSLTSSLVNAVRSVSRLKKESRLLIKTNKY